VCAVGLFPDGVRSASGLTFGWPVSYHDFYVDDRSSQLNGTHIVHFGSDRLCTTALRRGQRIVIFRHRPLNRQATSGRW
jgi:hypothetical protein